MSATIRPRPSTCPMSCARLRSSGRTSGSISTSAWPGTRAISRATKASCCRDKRRFAPGLTFELTKDATAGFKSLVFVQCSGDFEVPYKQNERRFDLLLNVYDTKPVRDDDAADIVVRQGGTKATAIRALLRSAPDLLLRYDAVLFLDDDVELSGPDIERLFATFASYALDVAQPALTADSACAFAVLKQPQAGTGVRPISAVEIMTPLISRRALVACRDVFDEGVSGWGLDVLLSTRVRERFGETIALIADVVAAHRRPIDLDGGNFYRYLLRYGIEPEHELGRLARRFGIETMPDAVRFVGHDPGDGQAALTKQDTAESRA